jgi:hypothetical protein
VNPEESVRRVSLSCRTDSLDSYKRLTQQKKQRERERKELEALGRRHLANVRVVQRNVAYVTGLGARFAKEDVRTPHPLLHLSSLSMGYS